MSLSWHKIQLRTIAKSFLSSGVFRGRATVRCPPPFGPTIKFFKATLYEKVRFLPFSSKNCKIQLRLMVFFHTDTICD